MDLSTAKTRLRGTIAGPIVAAALVLALAVAGCAGGAGSGAGDGGTNGDAGQASGRARLVFTAGDAGISHLLLLPDGRGAAVVVDPGGTPAVHALTSPGGEMVSFFEADRSQFVVRCRDHELEVRALPSGAEVQVFTPDGGSLVFAVDQAGEATLTRSEQFLSTDERETQLQGVVTRLVDERGVAVAAAAMGQVQALQDLSQPLVALFDELPFAASEPTYEVTQTVDWIQGVLPTPDELGALIEEARARLDGDPDTTPATTMLPEDLSPESGTGTPGETPAPTDYDAENFLETCGEYDGESFLRDANRPMGEGQFPGTSAQVGGWDARSHVYGEFHLDHRLRVHVLFNPHPRITGDYEVVDGLRAGPLEANCGSPEEEGSLCVLDLGDLTLQPGEAILWLEEQGSGNYVSAETVTGRLRMAYGPTDSLNICFLPVFYSGVSPEPGMGDLENRWSGDGPWGIIVN